MKPQDQAVGEEMFRLVTVKTLPSLLRTSCGKSFGELEAGETTAKLEAGAELDLHLGLRSGHNDERLDAMINS